MYDSHGRVVDTVLCELLVCNPQFSPLFATGGFSSNRVNLFSRFSPLRVYWFACNSHPHLSWAWAPVWLGCVIDARTRNCVAPVDLLGRFAQFWMKRTGVRYSARATLAINKRCRTSVDLVYLGHLYTT